MMKNWIYLNGKICQANDAKVPVYDRGFLFGDGIFTTIRVHQGICELYKAHMARLQDQARQLGFIATVQSEKWLNELIEKNQAGTGTWRLKIILTVDRQKERNIQGNLCAMVETYDCPSFNPCRLCVFPKPIESPTAHVKSLAYLDRFFVKDYAQNLGFDDAVASSGKGYVLETSCSNIFWIDRGLLYSPDPELPFLRGVFAKGLMNQLPIPVKFVKSHPDEIASTANIFTCNALTHVRPVVAIGTRIFSRNAEIEVLLTEAIGRALAQDSYPCIRNS